jgi:hypothetical protein
MAAELLSRRAYAAGRGCSDTAIRKAIRAGRIIPEVGLIDSEQADRNWYHWSRAAERDGAAYAAGRPAAEAAGAREAIPPASSAASRNGVSPRPAAAVDISGVTDEWLAAQLRSADEWLADDRWLDRQPSERATSGPQLRDAAAREDTGLHRLPLTATAHLDLDRLLSNIAGSIADGFNREGDLLVAVLTGIDDRLTAIERRAADESGQTKLDAVLTGQTRLFELLSELTGLLARRW